MLNNNLIINIPLEGLFVALEEKIRSTIDEVLREQYLQQQNEAQSHSDLMSRKQTCLLLGISLPTLSKYVASGKLPYSRIGKKILFDKNIILSSITKKGVVKC